MDPIKIGIFYDANYFLIVSNYFKFSHRLHRRIAVEGLHRWLRQKIAARLGISPDDCLIAAAHYFRGRIPVSLQNDPVKIVNERSFDDGLIAVGISTHYLPCTTDGEKGVDVALALEAFEMAASGRADIIVLIATDGDYVPLVRKLHSLGVRVFLVYWEFQFSDQNGHFHLTKASEALLKEVFCAFPMHTLMEEMQPKELGQLLLSPPEQGQDGHVDTGGLDHKEPEPPQAGARSERRRGRLTAFFTDYGFIRDSLTPNATWFFHISNVLPGQKLQPGDEVEFELEPNPRPEKGPYWAVRLQRVEQKAPQAEFNWPMNDPW